MSWRSVRASEASSILVAGIGQRGQFSRYQVGRSRVRAFLHSAIGAVTVAWKFSKLVRTQTWLEEVDGNDDYT